MLSRVKEKDLQELASETTTSVKLLTISLTVFLVMVTCPPEVDTLVANEWAINSYIKITDANFAGIAYDSTQKSIEVMVNESLVGTLTIILNNSGPGTAIYVVGATTSWGEHSLSYWSVGQFGVGPSTAVMNVDVTAPLVAGTYYIIIAGGWEFTAGQVTSATNWAVGELHWNDGNDIAGWNSTQINDARINGRAVGQKEMISGFEDHYYPADALKVTVLQAYEPPLSDAGPDQTVMEGGIVDFNGTGSRGSSFRSVLLLEDFEDGDCDDWNTIGGTPSIVTGSLDGTGNYLFQMVTEKELDGAMMFSDPSSLLWSNYKFEVLGRITEGNDDWSYLYFFFYSQSNTDFRNSYEVVLKAYFDVVELSIRSDGNRTVLNSTSITIDFGVVYHVAIEVEDGQIQVFVDGILRLVHFDENYTNGTVGFSTRTGGGSWTWVRSHFDNIKVTGWVHSKIVSYAWDFDDRVDVDGDGNYTNDADAIDMNPTWVYGDDGVYNATLTVTDETGAMAIDTCIITVLNVPPTASIATPNYSIDENNPITVRGTATDPGSDDLTFTWDWGDSTTEMRTYYNDGVSADPYPSPWGTYPFTVDDETTHIYGDNGIFTIILKVEDDDGGFFTTSTDIEIFNVDPVIDSQSIKAYVKGNISLRIAGEKWHDVSMTLYKDGGEIESVNVTRTPGSPNEQMATIEDVTIDIHMYTWSVLVEYTPMDDPINGQMLGANPVWIVLHFEDGSEVWIQHTFNVRHPGTYLWEIEDLRAYLVGVSITFEARASDPGSDDLYFEWDWGDGTWASTMYYNNGVSPDPYPSPDVNPITVTDVQRHVFAVERTYTVTLTVEDDDSGVAYYTLDVSF